MSKTIKTTKILSTIYQEWIRDKLKMRNSLLVGTLKTCNLTFNSREQSAYTTLEGESKNKLRVVIGGGMVSKVAGLPSTFKDKATLKPFLEYIVMAFYGLDYHEIGHVLFTDMKDRSIADYKEPKYISFLHNLFNILEDPVVEANMDALFKENYPHNVRPKVFFDFIIEQIFKPQCEEYKDDGTQTGFMQYLLLTVRCSRKAIRNECKIFTKYSSDLIPMLTKVVTEENPTERIHKVVALGEWIIENIKEFNWEMPELPEKEKRSGSMSGPSAPSPMSGSSMEGIPGEALEGGSPEGKSEGADISSDDSEEEGEDTSEKEDKTTEDSEEEEIPSPMEDIDIDDDVFDEVFNDDIHDGDDHEWVIAKDEYEYPESILDTLNNKIENYTDTINDVSKFLKLFKGRIKPRDMIGYTQGKLSVPTAIRNEMSGGCSTRVFKRSVARGKDADLCVSLLCDNSGSMSGRKSELCATAALTLAQACDWSGIPFECNAFTKTEDSMRGTCVTIQMKGFEDNFEKSKGFFAINDSTLIRKLSCDRFVPTFRGNSEEINLYYIWKKFAKVHHKTKLLFVLCDGATTGSRDDLKNIVRRIEIEDNIIVVGIGILCHEVADIYPHHKLFNSEEELRNDLAPYLVEMLSKYAV